MVFYYRTVMGNGVRLEAVGGDMVSQSAAVTSHLRHRLASYPRIALDSVFFRLSLEPTKE